MNSKILLCIIGCALLAACGKVPETHYFTLEWQRLAEQQSPHGVLHIQNFAAAPMLKSDKMMYKTSRYEIKYDNYRRWVMTPGHLLTHKAAEYYEDSGLFDRVVLDVPRAPESCSLFGRITHFEEINYGGEHKVVVAVNFELTDLAERKLLLNLTIEKEASIKGGTAEDIVEAMSQATKLLFDDLTTEIQKSL